jgi:hypothetical protein
VNPKAARKLRKSATTKERRKVDFSIPEIAPGLGTKGGVPMSLLAWKKIALKE